LCPEKLADEMADHLAEEHVIQPSVRGNLTRRGSTRAPAPPQAVRRFLPFCAATFTKRLSEHSTIAETDALINASGVSTGSLGA
jgi:hypothetical protein